MRTKIASLFKQHNIKNISCNSENIKLGDAFFAIKGEKFNGNDYIAEALEKGAIVFTDDQAKQAEKVLYMQDGIRLALAIGADILYPKYPFNLIAVTGTNGKSSVVSYVYQILKLLKKETAAIGTLGLESTLKIRESFLKDLPQSLTTPDPVTFRKILNELAEIGIDNTAFEASSHGIDQHRLGNIKVKTACFTSFSQDHLDYHGTMENYLKAKLQLFVNNLEHGAEVVINSELLESGYAILIKDFFSKYNIRYFEIGKNGDIKISNIKTSLIGIEVYFEYNKRNYQFQSSIIGSFQAVNLLIATKMIANIGLDFDQIIPVLEKVVSVTGRLQRIGNTEDDFHVFVDYSHTPDALEKSLSELKKIKADDGKLYVLFGCGGNRDPSKRVPMGEVACKLADYVVVTDDNPRNEDPQKIRHDILKGAKGAKEIDGRELAIENAIANLHKNDILLIAGKGHEEYQIVGNKILLFSDIEIAKKLIDLKRKYQQ